MEVVDGALNSITTAALAAVELSGLINMSYIAAATVFFYIAFVIYWFDQMRHKYRSPVQRLFILTVLTGVFFLVLAFVGFSKEYLR